MSNPVWPLLILKYEATGVSLKLASPPGGASVGAAHN
jgi:hypothetical protein